MVRWLATPMFARLAAATSLIGLATAFTTPFLVLFLTAELGVEPGARTVFLVLSSLAALFASSTLGSLSDRGTSRRALMFVGAAAGCCGYGLFAFVRDYLPLLAVSVTLVAVSTSLLPLTFAHAREALRGRESGSVTLAISWLRTLFSVTWVLGPPLAALLLGRAGFTALFGTAAVLNGLLAVILLGRGAASAAAAPKRARLGAMPRPVLLAAAAFVALQSANALGALVLPLWLTEDLHTGVGVVGVAVGLGAALEIPLMPALGALAARIPARRLVSVGALAGIAYYVAMSVSSEVWQALTVQLLNAVFVAAMMGIGISYFQDLLPDRLGGATALYTNTGRVGALVAGLLVGLSGQLGYRMLFVASGVLCAVGVILLLRAGNAEGAGKGSGSAGIGAGLVGGGVPDRADRGRRGDEPRLR